MKKIIYTVISILAVFAIHSCGPNYNIDGTAAIKSLEIAGQVIDLQGNPIPNVEVTANGKVTTTDDNGFFFVSTSSSSKTYFIKFNKDGYFPNIRSGKILSDEIKVKVALVSFNDNKSSVSLNTETGGTLSISTPYGNATINFPAGLKYVVSSTGDNYSGDFTAYGFYVDPTNSMYPYIVPGGKLWGIKNSKLKKIKPYVGIFVMLIDQYGRKINLINNSTNSATLSLPIPSALQSTAPDTIDFWSDDFNKSFCYMSGSGSRDQDKYIAEVRHFSYWRAALDYSQTTTYTGSVTDCNGHAVPGVMVKINNAFSGYTNIEGKYKIEAPRGLVEPTVTVAPEDYANQGFYDIIYQTVDENTYTYNISLPCVQTITGRVLNCKNNTVPSYIAFSYYDSQVGNNITVTTIAPRGLFRLYIPTYIASGHLRIITQQGVFDKDINNLTGGTVDNYNTYNICEQSQGNATVTISGYEFGDNGITYDSLQYSAYYASDFTDFSLSNNDFSIFIYFPSKIGSFQLDTNWTSLEAGTSAYGSFYVQSSQNTYNIYSGSLSITTFDTTSKIVSGSFYGQAGNSDTTYTISGSFDSIPLQQN